MSRETKFGYGFCLAGIGAPFLIDKMVGQTAAIWCACICTLIGAALLVSGHLHKEQGKLPPTSLKKASGYGVMVLLLFGLAIGMLKYHPHTAATRSDSNEPAEHPKQTDPPQNIAPPSRQSHAAKIPTVDHHRALKVPPENEVMSIVQRAVDKFTMSHSGQWPTQAWINQELKSEGYALFVDQYNPPPSNSNCGGTGIRLSSPNVHFSNGTIDQPACNIGLDIRKGSDGSTFDHVNIIQRAAPAQNQPAPSAIPPPEQSSPKQSEPSPPEARDLPRTGSGVHHINVSLLSGSKQSLETAKAAAKEAFERYEDSNGGRLPNNDWLNAELSREGYHVFANIDCEAHGTAIYTEAPNVQIEEANIQQGPCDVGILVTGNSRGSSFDNVGINISKDGVVTTH